MTQQGQKQGLDKTENGQPQEPGLVEEGPTAVLRYLTGLLGQYASAVSEYVVACERGLPRTHLVDRASAVRTELVDTFRALIGDASREDSVLVVDRSRSSPSDALTTSCIAAPEQDETPR
jgi:hypothetical protein